MHTSSREAVRLPSGKGGGSLAGRDGVGPAAEATIVPPRPRSGEPVSVRSPPVSPTSHVRSSGALRWPGTADGRRPRRDRGADRHRRGLRGSTQADPAGAPTGSDRLGSDPPGSTGVTASRAPPLPPAPIRSRMPWAAAIRSPSPSAATSTSNRSCARCSIATRSTCSPPSGPSCRAPTSPWSTWRRRSPPGAPPWSRTSPSGAPPRRSPPWPAPAWTWPRWPTTTAWTTDRWA